MSAYQGARITNRGGANAIVQIVPTLAPGSSIVTPKHPSPASISDLRVRDVGASPVVLEAEERGYQLERTLGLDVPGRPTFEATLKRGGDFADEVFGVYLVGMGSNCGEDEAGMPARAGIYCAPVEADGAVRTRSVIELN